VASLKPRSGIAPLTSKVNEGAAGKVTAVHAGFLAATIICLRFLFLSGKGIPPSRVVFTKSAHTLESTGVEYGTFAQERRRSAEVIGNAAVTFSLCVKES
jgi:hypothetical protein